MLFLSNSLSCTTAKLIQLLLSFCRSVVVVLCPYVRVNRIDSFLADLFLKTIFTEMSTKRFRVYESLCLKKQRRLENVAMVLRSFLLLKTFVITTVIIPESNGLLPLVFNILLVLHI